MKTATPKNESDDQPIVPPPSTMTVDWFTKKPVLYTANGQPLARKVGF